MPRRKPLYGSTCPGEGRGVNSASMPPGVTGAAIDGAAVVAELFWPVPRTAFKLFMTPSNFNGINTKAI